MLAPADILKDKLAYMLSFLQHNVNRQPNSFGSCETVWVDAVALSLPAFCGHTLCWFMDAPWQRTARPLQ